MQMQRSPFARSRFHWPLVVRAFPYNMDTGSLKGDGTSTDDVSSGHN